MAEFLTGVLSLFNHTFSAIMTQPALVLFLAAMLLAIALSLFRLLCRAAKKM